MKEPLVSVIVTTRNNHETLEACLSSIAEQSYTVIELIVVDNNSSDDTKAIARRYTEHVYDKGPERSAQRNYGVSKTSGDYVLIIDSDMELSPDVVKSCVKTVSASHDIGALIIPEESFGKGFWAQCKRLERSFYVGVDAIEAARFFSKKPYLQIGGYDETMTGGEDWDLTNRARIATNVGRSDAYIYHNEGRLYFGKTLRKMYYYASHADAFFAQNPDARAFANQSGPLARFKLFFTKPHKLFKNPIVGAGMLTLKLGEYASGGFGYMQARSTQRRRARENS